MILDLQNLVSDGQDLSQAAGSYLSTNAIDLTGGTFTSPGGYGTISRDAAKGEDLNFFVQIDETFTSGGAATLTVELIMSANSDLSSYVVLHTTPALALATLVAGYLIRIAVPKTGLTSRYLGVRYTIGTATTTAGTCTAGIAVDVDTSPQVMR